MTWIKCCDEIPPIDERVLLVTEYGRIVIGCWGKPTDPMKPYRWYQDGSGIRHEREHFTHWMRLPDRPLYEPRQATAVYADWWYAKSPFVI